LPAGGAGKREGREGQRAHAVCVDHGVSEWVDGQVLPFHSWTPVQRAAQFKPASENEFLKMKHRKMKKAPPLPARPGSK
jgi:hypothetical protein